MKKQTFILSIIVAAQFLCTSLWFAGNAVLPDLQVTFNLMPDAVGDLTSAVQFGFIAGTLTFALLTISDRYSPSTVFFICSVLGAFLNASIIFSNGLGSLLVARVLTGFCLAGIYPVGMKISADYFEKGLGTALGFLVGALVLGTAFPHLIRLFIAHLDWRYVIISTSFFAVLGGLLILLFVPDGPFRKKQSKVDFSLSVNVFKEEKFRNAAFGYFGHMWELYTFWAFVPVIIGYFNSQQTAFQLSVGLWSFISIASGGVACIIGGFLSKKIGNAKTAFLTLFISGICCLTSFGAFQLPAPLFMLFILIWGMTVVADSPQFSTLVAQLAPREATGTALTIVNSIGFAITIISLQVMNFLIDAYDFRLVFVTLAIGPLLGLISIRKNIITA